MTPKALVAIVLVVAAGNVLLAHPASGQPTPFSIPQDPIASYFDTLVIPVMAGKTPAAQEVGKFYRGYLSIHTQIKVTEEQFLAYWQGIAQRAIGSQFWAAVLLGATYTLTYDIGEPVYNDAKDQARFKITVTITTHRGFFPSSENRIIFAHVIREDSVWKIVLSDELVAEILKTAPPQTTTAKKYILRAEASAQGLRVTVRSLVTDKDVTSLEIVARNEGTESVDLFNAISAATLTDQTGQVYASRTLRSSLAASVGPGQSASGVLAFFAVPSNTRRLTLTIPHIRIGNEVVAMTLELNL